MRENKLAIDFLDKLTTAFCPDFDPRDGTQELYAEKLSTHSLSSAQWDRVFDLLTDWHRQRGLPPLGMIQSAIGEVQAPERYEASSRRGKMTFQLDGYQYSPIIQLEAAVGGGKHWVIARIIRDKHGEKVELQKHGGMDVDEFLSKIPGAVFVGIFPDDPKLAYRGERATPEEIAEFGAAVRERTDAKKKQNSGKNNPQGDGKWIAMESKRRERVA